MTDRFRVQVDTESWSGRGLALACVDCKEVVTRNLPAQVSLERLITETTLHNAAAHPPQFVYEVMTAESVEPIVRFAWPPGGGARVMTR